MKPGRILAILIASVLIISFAIALIKEDALVQESEFRPPSYLNIREVDVKPVEVTSATVEVNVTAYIDHSGGKTKNASMLLRAISSDTGLLASQISAPIPETESADTLAVSQHLKVERNGGYELKILIFDNGSIRDSGSVNVRGLSTLTPQSKRNGIVLNNIDFMINGVSAGRVGVKSDVYLENRGSEATENLNLIVKARQADSNILADKKNSETGVIASEVTAVKSVSLEVPDEYNYMIVAELWKGDVLINSWEKPLLLAPTKTVPKETTEKKVNIEVSKFVREGGIPGATSQERAGAPYMGTPKEPGFEILTAIAALIVIASRRRLKW